MLFPYGKDSLLANPSCVLPELRAAIRIAYPVNQLSALCSRVSVPIAAQLVDKFYRYLVIRRTLCQHFLPEITRSFQRNSLVAPPLASAVFWNMGGLDGRPIHFLKRLVQHLLSDSEH